MKSNNRALKYFGLRVANGFYLCDRFITFERNAAHIAINLSQSHNHGYGDDATKEKTMCWKYKRNGMNAFSVFFLISFFPFAIESG